LENEGRSVVALGYDAVFDATPKSPTLRRLWREFAIGDDFPEEFLHISFVTLPQLRRMAADLQIHSGDTLVDLGCGMAGPALWVARETGANLIGVDLSSVAVALASERANELGLSSVARFLVGSFEATGLDDASAGGAMSEDALQYAPDKKAALREAARILRPGGRLVFTAFELDPGHVEGLPVIGDDPVDDYRPLLDLAGFNVEAYEEIPGWPEPVRTTYQSLLDAKEALIGEMGPVAATAFFTELTMTLQREIYRRRIFTVAAKR
jgi:ubiquinone/menaquinone biosynthesis C-methylase UbiE